MKVTKYTINDKIFDTWIEESAYLIGYIAADGCIHKRKDGGKVLHIASKDKDSLINISSVLNSNKPIYEYTDKRFKTTVYSIQIYSKYICNKLESIGIHPQKSLTLDWIKAPSNVLPHFIRGYFDGDGCVSINISSRSINISFAGTINFLTGIYDSFKSFYQQANGKIIKQGNIFVLNYSSYKDAVKWNEYLYNQATIKLERKYQTFQKLKEIKYTRKYQTIQQGVCKYKNTNKWKAKYKDEYLGIFNTEQEASDAIDKYVESISRVDCYQI